jgi:two-component system, OmpR family, phosphate regulon sensor histidine kinase PhoR
VESKSSKPVTPSPLGALWNRAGTFGARARRIAAGLLGRPDNATVAPGEHGGTLGAETLAWQAILDALPGAAIALDGAGVVIHHNAPAAELYPNIKVGQPISHVSRNPEFMGAVERIWTSAEPISVELQERVPVERRFFATLARIARPSTLASLPELLITFRDYSEQDKLAQMRADFIANASHELRTPLASLRGFVETLQGPARDDPQARDRFLSIMATQAARMTRLIDDLLSLSRAEMRVHLPPRGIVELNETCAFVVQTLEPLAESSRVTVVLARLPSPALIRGEREEIVQVLQNLLQNAIKYGHDGGHVQVQLSREPGLGTSRERLSVAIQDDGPGIGPEHLPRLTERFYRASVASSRDKGGTGLGLAIVKHIVNRHRGDLRIQSKVGSGSTFTVIFDALSSERLPPPRSVEKNQAKSELKIVIK